MIDELNLNLSKQIRKAQKKTGADSFLETTFGKNVYRLYYDLDTGQQITPTNKKPALQNNIEIGDELRTNVDARLKEFGYQVVDFDKNVASKNNQQIKITKVLSKLDNGLLNQYTSYLDAMTKSTEGGENSMR